MAEEPSSTSAAKWGKSAELTNFSGTFVLSLFLSQLLSWLFSFQLPLY
jgi:hypothetical protein